MEGSSKMNVQEPISQGEVNALVVGYNAKMEKNYKKTKKQMQILNKKIERM